MIVYRCDKCKTESTDKASLTELLVPKMVRYCVNGKIVVDDSYVEVCSECLHIYCKLVEGWANLK